MMKKTVLSLIMTVLIVSGCAPKDPEPPIEDPVIEKTEEERIILGDERFTEYLPLLEGKRVALFTNQTGIVGDLILNEGYAHDDLTPFGQDAYGNELEFGPHILDVLLEKGIDVVCVFAPEHGFRGTADAGADVDDYVDEKTGVPILSLYSEGSLYPSAEDMERFDILVCDMQDVGLRYYTYYISMYRLMEACSQYDKTFMILDRPDPNGFYVDGPILKEEYQSDIGVLPLPVVYGMTWGELARMINSEGWLCTGKDSCDLIVIPCQNYTHQTKSALIMRPSPNLKDMRSVYLYASTCFFEYTAVSVGRGTDHPFEIYGSPYFEDCEIYDYSFVPASMEGAQYPQYEDEVCYGRQLLDIPLENILSAGIDLEYLIEAYEQFHERYPDESFFGSEDYLGHYWIDYLSGSDELRTMITEGLNARQIKEVWRDDLEEFIELRRPYLIYPE